MLAPEQEPYKLETIYGDFHISNAFFQIRDRKV